MAMIPIENVGTVGVITDVPAHTLPPEAWSSVENVRFAEGYAEKFTGQETVFGTPSVAPHFLLAWSYASEYRWVYPSTATIYHTNGVAHTNVTRFTTTQGDDDYSAGTRPVWTGSVFNGVPVLNHSNGTDYPQQWNDTTQRFEDLNNWQVNTYCKSIGAFKNFLIAVNITKTSTTYPYLVKWSSVADPGTVPGSWDEADATVLAGENPLAETGGVLLFGLSLGNQYVLYKEDSIISMKFVGGINVFSFDTVTNTTGILSQRCAVEFFKNHIVVGKSDIVRFDGFKVQSIIDKKNRDLFFEDLHDGYKAQTILSVDYATREIWISYVSVGSTSTYLDKALVWNWESNVWTFRDLPDLTYITQGRVVQGVQTIDGLVGTIDALPGTFNSYASTGVESLIFAKAYTTSEFMQGDKGFSDRGTALTTTLERTGLAVAGVDRQGSPTVDPSKVKFLRSVFPKISAQTAVTLDVYAGSQESPEGPISWEGPYSFNSATDVKVDFMVSGKYLAIRFVDEGTLPWKLDGYVLDLDIISEL